MKKNKLYCFLRWIRSFVGLGESIISILTFGFYNPMWTFKMLAWETKRNVKRGRNGKVS